MAEDLAGTKVLLVEDEAIIAMMAEDMLEELGCEILVTATSLADAMIAIRSRQFDVAVLDINLNGQDSLPAAAMLHEMKRPFIFTTGYGISGRGAEYDDVPLVTKPYRLADLAEALALALRADRL